MLYPLSRSAIFRACPFADHLIAQVQKAYASDFDLTDKKDLACLKRLYDHREPLQPAQWPKEQFCVLTWATDDIKQYETAIGRALEQFLSALGIGQLYLLGLFKERFPFETFSKRNTFRRLAGSSLDYRGFLLHASDLAALLPLLFFSGIHGRPVIYLFAAGTCTPLALHLCDDGNFHTDYLASDEQKIREAATGAGLLSGAENICRE